MTRECPTDARLIPLTRGAFAIVDAEDYGWLSRWKWHCSAQGYAVRREYLGTEGRPFVNMAREILGLPRSGREVVPDHINGNKLDNRRANLRRATLSQNGRNKRNTGGASEFIGVYFNPSVGRFRAYSSIDGQQVHLGWFADEERAARARDEFVVTHGLALFAPLNFPDEWEATG
jgi:hypothetical protein